MRKMNKLKSRKLWIAVASGLFIILTEGLGVNIAHEVYWSVVGIAAAYIFGESYIDAKRK